MYLCVDVHNSFQWDISIRMPVCSATVINQNKQAESWVWSSPDPVTISNNTVHPTAVCKGVCACECVCVFKGVWESNQGNNGHLNHQCQNNTPFHTPEGESISATFDSNPYQLAPELQPSTLSPPPQLHMMDYHLWQRERKMGGGGQSLQGHIHRRGALG